MTQVWAAGFNMPGFLCTTEPEHFATWQEAAEYLDSVMASDGDDYEETENEHLSDVLDDARNELTKYTEQEFSITIGGTAYWVSRVIDF